MPPYDPLDSLTPPTTAGVDPATKRRVLDATLTELRRQRGGRLRNRVVGLAAMLAAAALLFALMPPAPQVAKQRPRQDASAPPTAGPTTTAVDLEWAALDRPDEAKRLYREAGERYVGQGDFAGAVRSYGGALDAGAADDLEPTSDDDYLLLAIKLARLKKEQNQ